MTKAKRIAGKHAPATPYPPTRLHAHARHAAPRYHTRWPHTLLAVPHTLGVPHTRWATTRWATTRWRRSRARRAGGGCCRGRRCEECRVFGGSLSRQPGTRRRTRPAGPLVEGGGRVGEGEEEIHVSMCSMCVCITTPIEVWFLPRTTRPQGLEAPLSLSLTHTVTTVHRV